MVRVRVVAYDEAWPRRFLAVEDELAAALGGSFFALHHIGSTSIPRIYAKPIVDVLAVVDNLRDLDGRTAAIESLGYEALGEFGIDGRRYFRRNNVDGERTEQIHAFQRGSDHVARHLAFRDYLRSTPEVAQEYSELKRRLATEHPDDIEAYMDGKDPFIKTVEAKAVAWIVGMEVRTTARLMLFDAAGRVLLFRHSDGHGREFWATPGGGLEPGETLRQAARREAREELGIETGELELLWTGHSTFRFADRRVSQAEAYFLVCEHAGALGPAVDEMHRSERILETRWWSAEEIERAGEAVVPADLARRVRMAASF